MISLFNLYPLNLYLIKNVEDIVVFFSFKVFWQDSFVFAEAEMRKSLYKEITIENYPFL